MKKLIFLLILCGCAAPITNYNCTEVVYKAVTTQNCTAVLGFRNNIGHAWMECDGKTVDLLGTEEHFCYTPLLKGKKALELIEIEQKYHIMGYDATIVYDGHKFLVIYKNPGGDGWRIH